VIRCPSCGTENREGARFCDSCGSALSASAGPAGEVRKTVTILFADIVSSTARGEETDPESTRRMLARYFDAMRRVVERHGGTVEKFIGDAVMAVFGIPNLHEDDALRAVRAAHDTGIAIEAVNQELASSGWPPIAVRIGVNTGEVMAGDPASGQTLVTGDPVNVAARLEQTARPGEVILGAATHRLVRGAVEAEPMAPLELKGKAATVDAFRLLRLKERESEPRDTPLVDRIRELHLLSEAFQRAKGDGACYLFTLLGAAGVGKSRLVREFLGRTGAQAQVLRARCLPYGEGITFWPVIELTHAAATIHPNDPPEVAMARLETLLEGTDEQGGIAERIAATIGLTDKVVPAEETFWAMRKLLETVALKRPLIVVIDDLHWAEPTLLDLVDHVADWSREAPILLLAVARPELLDERPQWAGGKLNATTILLEPLNPRDSEALIGNLLRDETVARSVQERIGETAEGNPLFLEELVAVLLEQGALRRHEGRWEAAQNLEAIHVPPTISALVGARLDRLDPPERDLIGRASVVGKVFQRSAVTELSPADRRSDLGVRLMALVRKELVRPERSAPTGDEAFRFRHILVRDAAYASLPKEERADLHARFAGWLERITGDRLLEYEEVIAYHLEQAYRYRAELGFTEPLTASLAGRAATHLRVAGMRALARHDTPAADNLLSRTIALLKCDARHGEVMLMVAGLAGETGNVQRAMDIFAEVSAQALGDGDDLLDARAQLASKRLGLLTDPHAGQEAILDLADRLEVLATERGSAESRAEAELARAHVWLGRCQWMAELSALERALSLLGPTGDPASRSRAELDRVIALRFGPVPVPEAIPRIEQIAATTESLGTLGRMWLAPLLAMRGEFGKARKTAEAGRAYLEERGLVRPRAGVALVTGIVEALAGDLEASARAFEDGVALHREIGAQTGLLSTLAALHATVLYRLGRLEEMRPAVRLARETAAPNDVATQVEWRIAEAPLAADEGRLAEAELLVGEALALVQPTDFLELRGQAYEALAHVEARAGRPEDWRRGLEQAVAEHRRKGNIVEEQRIGGLLGGPPPTPSAQAVVSKP